MEEKEGLREGVGERERQEMEEKEAGRWKLRGVIWKRKVLKKEVDGRERGPERWCRWKRKRN